MNEDTKKRINKTIETHKKMLAEFEAGGTEIIAAAAEAITKALKNKNRIYICGNGGSAADAQHIVGELVGRFECERQALPVIAMTTNTSLLTSLANDYNYDKVFVRQVEAFVREGDILWGISTSGNSPNVVAAAELAKKKGALVLAFTGRSNSKLEQTADICFCANDKSTARSQEIHQLAYHIICGLVEQNFT